MPTPEEVLAEFTRMQQEKNKPAESVEDKAVVVNSPNSIFGVVPSINELPTPIVDELPGDKSLGPDNPVEIPITQDRLPRVPSTGPIVPPTTIRNVFDGRARVPGSFMSSVSVILKDAGADSMSQEKALAKIQALLEYPKAEPDMTERRPTGTPVHQIPAEVGPDTNKVVKSDVPGHNEPE